MSIINRFNFERQSVGGGVGDGVGAGDGVSAGAYVGSQLMITETRASSARTTKKSLLTTSFFNIQDYYEYLSYTPQ